MKPTWAAAFCVALLTPAAADAQLATSDDPVQAISRSREEPAGLDIGILAGRFAFTDWSDRVVLGSVGPANIDEVVVRDLRVEPAGGFDAAVTYWRGRWGFRTHGGFSASCVGAASGCFDSGSIDVNTWLFDVGGAVRLGSLERTRVVRPYVFGGVGAVAYDIAAGIGPNAIARLAGAQQRAGRPLVIADRSGEFLLTVDELGLETSLAGTLGLGVDLRVPLGGGGVGVRIEAADHVSRSPVELRLTRLDDFFGALPTTEVDFGVVHHLRLSAGIVIDFGFN